jgi:hypothetical protein
MGLWATVLMVAVALFLGAALYVVVRWRAAPVAFRAIRRVAAVYFLAGFLAGLWTLRVTSPTAPAKERTGSSTPTGTSSGASSEAPPSEPSPVDPQLNNAILKAREFVQDFGSVTVGDLLNCFERSPKHWRVVGESDRGNDTYVIRLQDPKGEWQDLYFDFGGNSAEGATLLKEKLGNGETFDNWEELIVMVRAIFSACGKVAPY